MNGRELFSAAARVLEARPELVAAYVYGSAAAGRATPLSDVDLAIVTTLAPSSERRGTLLRELTMHLERTCSGARFDVRFFDELPLAIRGRVVGDGRCIVDRDPPRRVEAEVRTRMAYHDFLFFEREGTRAGLRALRKVASRG